MSKQKTYKDKVIENEEFLIDTLCSVMEFRNTESNNHIARIKKFTRIIIDCVSEEYPEYELTEKKKELIVIASAIHDLGKIAIKDSILLKPMQLTDMEFEEIKKHPIYGCNILEKHKQKDNDFYKICYDICRYHHERYDGTGYPDGLKGEKIPIWAQVVGIVDVFDALVSKRVYKGAYRVDEALKMIKNGDCGEFSEKIINCIIKSEEQLKIAAKESK